MTRPRGTANVPVDTFGFPISWSIQTRREIRRFDDFLRAVPTAVRERWDRARSEADAAVRDLPTPPEKTSRDRLARQRVTVAIPFPIQTGGMRVQMQLAKMMAAEGAEVHVRQVRGDDCTDDVYADFGLASREPVGGPDRLVTSLRKTGPSTLLAGCWIDYPRAFEAGIGPVLGYSAGEPTLKEDAPFDERLLSFRIAAHRLPITLIAGSQFIHSVYRERFGRDSLSLSVPIAEEIFAFKPGPTPGPSKFRVVIVGPEHLTTKGIPGALRALQPLRSDGVQIVWISSVHPSEQSTHLVDEFHVGLDATRVAEVVSSCHALVFPSRLEGLGNPPLEAMALGVPSILCPNGGSSEYAIDEENCLLVPYGRAEPLRTAVCRLRDDADLVTRLRGAGKITAKRYHPATVRQALTGFLASRAATLPSAAELQNDHSL